MLTPAWFVGIARGLKNVAANRMPEAELQAMKASAAERREGKATSYGQQGDDWRQQGGGAQGRNRCDTMLRWLPEKLLERGVHNGVRMDKPTRSTAASEQMLQL